MPTVIDALIVTLGIDDRGFKRGETAASGAQKRMRDDAERTSKAFQDVGRQISGAINSTRNAAIGLFAVFTAGAGIRSFVANTTEGSAALGRMSRDLAMSTQQLSAWEGVSRRAGNAAGQVTQAFSGIQEQIQNFRLYGTPLSATFRALGVDLADPITGAARSLEDIYKDVLERLHSRSPRERGVLAAGLGLGQESVNLAALPRADRERQLVEQARLGVTTPEEAQRATVLRQAWLDLEQALTTTSRRLLNDLTPGIISVLDQLKEFAVYLGGEDFKPVFASLSRSVQEFARYIGSDDFTKAMKDFRDGIVELAQKIVEALRWLGLIARPDAPAQPGTVADLGWFGRIVRPSQIPPPGTAAPGAPAAGAAPAAPPAAEGGGIGGWFRRTFPNWQTRSDTDAARRQRSDAEFRQEFGPAAARVAERLGTSTDAVLAHWSLETNNGRSFAGQNNLGNMTALPGQNATAGGDRDANGNPIQQRFRNFGSINEFADSYASWVERRAPGVRGQTDAAAYGAALQAGGYATDPNFSRSLGGVARRFSTNDIPLPPPQAPDPALINGARQGASLRWGGSSNVGSSSSVETNINGPITVQTSASDAAGIARDLAGALARQTFVSQSTLGLA